MKLPFGCTQEEWDATNTLREHYTKLLTILDEHSQNRHPWNSWCECEEAQPLHDMLAFTMSEIRRCLIRPDYLGDLRKKRQVARTLSDIGTLMDTPDIIYKIMSSSEHCALKPTPHNSKEGMK